MRLTDKKCNFGYTNSSNKLNSITIGANTYNYLYDNTGNLVQENSSRFFQWDAGNNMRCFYNQAGTSEPTVYAQYLYDAAGNRVKKIVRTQGGGYESVSYINDIFDYKTDGTGDKATSYIMDNSSRIAIIRTGADFGDSTPAIKYNLEDHLGSSTVLLDSNGTLINKEEYYPFGETSFGSYAKKRYRFSGKERDAESGLYYYGARYYLPMSCRFISRDPLAYSYPGLSPYLYAYNNPIVFIDILGLEGGPAKDRIIDPTSLCSTETTPNGGTMQVPMEASNLTYFGSSVFLTVTKSNNSYRKQLNIAPNSLSGFDYLGETYYADFDASGYFTGYQSTTSSDNFIKYGLGNKSLPINTTSVPRTQEGNNELMAGGAVILMDSPAIVVAGMFLALYYASNYQNISVLFEMKAPIRPIGGFVETIDASDVSIVVQEATKVKDLKPGDVVPTPETDEGLFKRGSDGEWINKDTGEIWSKVRGKAHRGEKWKVWPKGTKGRGKTPDRRNVGKDGTIRPGN